MIPPANLLVSAHHFLLEAAVPTSEHLAASLATTLPGRANRALQRYAIFGNLGLCKHFEKILRNFISKYPPLSSGYINPSLSSWF